jgi:biopolymer transport protein ExbD
MKTRKLFEKNKTKADPSMSLQITSMADVFTILLVFLLKGLASDALQITPSNATKLPVMHQAHGLSESALKIEITPNEVMVEKEAIGTLQDFKKGLNEKLVKERKKQDLISKTNQSVKQSSKAIVLADTKTPYTIVKSVLKSLSDQGYSEIHFAVFTD